MLHHACELTRGDAQVLISSWVPQAAAGSLRHRPDGAFTIASVEVTAHCWLAAPLQGLLTTSVPGVLPPPAASRHRVVPLSVTVIVPFECAVQFCAAVPLQFQMSTLVPAMIPDSESSTHSFAARWTWNWPVSPAVVKERAVFGDPRPVGPLYPVPGVHR